ncbi:MAG TPA: DUF1634 domain-containing protein [Capsulimonadaceae bacterium]|nr:DUF1634 domain-containing protein [Capsulimonadaceae bacterium]
MAGFPENSLDSLEGVPPGPDQRLDLLIARILRVGVGLAALLVAAGLVILTVKHGSDAAAFREFTPRPVTIHHGLIGVFERSLHRHSARDLIDFGLLVLIMTPVLRVACSVVVYLYENDHLYVYFTLIVLFVLLYSLTGG